jgi:hypothetical protein
VSPPSKARSAELLVQRLPDIASAKEARLYRLGSYWGVLFSEVACTGVVVIDHALAVLTGDAQTAASVLVAEHNKLAGFWGTGSRRLVCFDGAGRHELGASDDWQDLAAFERRALAEAASRLGVSEPPERVRRQRAEPAPAASPKTSSAPLPAERPRNVARVEEPTPELPAPESRPVPSSLRRFAHRAGSTPGFKQAAGVGAVGGLVLLLKVLVHGAACGAHMGSSYMPPPMPLRPPERLQPDGRMPEADPTPAPDPVLDPLVLDDAHVYWASKADGSIYVEPKDLSATRLLTKPTCHPLGLAADGKYLYVTCSTRRRPVSSAHLLRVDKTSGLVSPLARAGSRAAAPVLAGHTVLYLATGPDEADLAHQDRQTYSELVRLGLDPAAVPQAVDVGEALGALVADDRRVYWIPWASSKIASAPLAAELPSPSEPQWDVGTWDEAALSARDAGVGRADAGQRGGEPRIDGGARSARPSEGGAEERQAWTLAVDRQNLYAVVVSSSGSTTLVRAPKNGSRPTAVATVAGMIWSVVCHDSSVWWIEQPANALRGSIWRASSAGGAPVVQVTEEVPTGARLAIDDARVYWTTGTGIDAAPRRATR